MVCEKEIHKLRKRRKKVTDDDDGVGCGGVGGVAH